MSSDYILKEKARLLSNQAFFAPKLNASYFFSGLGNKTFLESLNLPVF